MRRYLNRPDLVKQVQNLLQMVRDGDQTMAPDVAAISPGGRNRWSVRTRLNQERVQELIALKQAGMTNAGLARQFGISESSVKRLMRYERDA